MHSSSQGQLSPQIFYNPVIVILQCGNKRKGFIAIQEGEVFFLMTSLSLNSTFSPSGLQDRGYTLCYIKLHILLFHFSKWQLMKKDYHYQCLIKAIPFLIYLLNTCDPICSEKLFLTDSLLKWEQYSRLCIPVEIRAFLCLLVSYKSDLLRLYFLLTVFTCYNFSWPWTEIFGVPAIEIANWALEFLILC